MIWIKSNQYDNHAINVETLNPPPKDMSVHNWQFCLNMIAMIKSNCHMPRRDVCEGVTWYLPFAGIIFFHE